MRIHIRGGARAFDALMREDRHGVAALVLDLLTSVAGWTEEGRR